MRSKRWAFQMMLVVVIATAGAASQPEQAAAQAGTWSAQDALHEASSEAAYCEAYYSVAQHCADSAGNVTLSSQLQDVIDSASALQFRTGRSAGMSNAAMLEFLKLALKGTTDSIDNSCANVAVLIAKYADACKSLLENPNDRIQVLMRGLPTTDEQ